MIAGGGAAPGDKMRSKSGFALTDGLTVRGRE
jgi:hypothetical protein